MKRIFFSLLFLSAVFVSPAQNVGINATGAMPDNSAMLDINSTSKGLLIPRLSLSGRSDATTVPTPAPYLLVYNINPLATGGLTGEGLYVNTGTSAAPAWKKVNASVNVKGTGTPNLLARWKSPGDSLTNGLVYDDSLHVGINTVQPKARLHVQGHDSTIYNNPDVGNNIKTVAFFEDTISYSGPVLGVKSITGSGSTNVPFFGTNTQRPDSGSASYRGLVIDNYDNHLYNGYVEGLYTDLGINKGQATGYQNFVLCNDTLGYSYGIKSMTYGYGQLSGFDNTVLPYGKQDAFGVNTFVGGGQDFNNMTGGQFFVGGDIGESKMTGVYALIDGYSAVPGRQVGIQSLSYSEETPTEATGFIGMANPAGYFTADGGSGQAIYAESVGTGYNSNVFASPLGEAIKAVSLQTSNHLNFGLQAIAGNATINNYAVTGRLVGTGGTGTSAAILGVDSINTAGSYAGYFMGQVKVDGALSAVSSNSAIKAFKIDNPANPANEYLYHSSVESPDMMNLYNGNITTDANGNASVSLPGYFMALNKDFRYQLTVIGSFAQAMVAKEVENNSFTIKSSVPNTKISWQVTGIRHDAMADKYRIQNVVAKTGTEKGKYLYPQAYNITDNAKTMTHGDGSLPGATYNTKAETALQASRNAATKTDLEAKKTQLKEQKANLKNKAGAR